MVVPSMPSRYAAPENLARLLDPIEPELNWKYGHAVHDGCFRGQVVNLSDSSSMAGLLRGTAGGLVPRSRSTPP